MFRAAAAAKAPFFFLDGVWEGYSKKRKAEEEENNEEEGEEEEEVDEESRKRIRRVSKRLQG